MNTDLDGKQHLRELLTHKQSGAGSSAPPTPDSAAVMRSWPPSAASAAAAAAAAAAAGNPAAMVSQQQRPEFSTRAPTPGYPPPRGWNPMDGEPPMRPQCMLSVLSKYCQYVYINTLLQWLTLCDCHSTLILSRIILQPSEVLFHVLCRPRSTRGSSTTRRSDVVHEATD